MLNKQFTVKFKENEIKGFMLSIGVSADQVYQVVGTIGDKLLLQVGNNFLEVYPRHLIIVGEYEI